VVIAGRIPSASMGTDPCCTAPKSRQDEVMIGTDRTISRMRRQARHLEPASTILAWALGAMPTL